MRNSRSPQSSHEPRDKLALFADGRGISDVIGYVLVFSLVVSVVGVVSVSGFASLSDIRDAEQANNAERAFDVLSDNTADIYEHGAPSRATEISLADAGIRTTDTVTINVSVNDTSSADNMTFTTKSRTIVWEGRGNTEIVYSLGATLRDDRQGGIVLSAPPFQLDSDRTVIPVVQLRSRGGQAFSGSTIRIRAVHGSTSVSLSEETPKYDEAWINITTPRASIWEQHLDQYPDTDCQVETKAGGETVVCEIFDREEIHITLTRIGLDLEG